MGDNRSRSLRFPVALVLSIGCLTAPAWADFEAGEKAYSRGDYATALREWQPLAKQGQAVAQYHLGLLHANGQGVPNDDVQARQWYEKAAAQGHANPQASLGTVNGGTVGALQRDELAIRMTSDQLAEAKKLAREGSRWANTRPWLTEGFT